MDKDPDAVVTPDAPLAEHRTMLHAGTLVVTAVIGVVALVVGLAEMSQGAAWHDVVLVAVALAVSAIPEGLPVTIVVALAVAVRRMGHRHVIVRHLSARVMGGLGPASTRR